MDTSIDGHKGMAEKRVLHQGYSKFNPMSARAPKCERTKNLVGDGMGWEGKGREGKEYRGGQVRGGGGRRGGRGTIKLTQKD